MEAIYCYGLIHGVDKIYYDNENNSLNIETNYLNGKKEGERKYYFKN